MNEQQPIFTPEQFRTQAVELSQAVAELHRRDSRLIDPHDPFENETEFHDYQSDYAEIVPQIRIPGCRIPLQANDREKSKIRRFYNTVGGFLLMHLIFSNVLALGIEALILALLRLSDTALVGDLPDNYNELAAAYISGSSSMIALNLLAFGVMNVLVVLLGCRATKIPIPNLFRTKKLDAFSIFSYITIALLLQCAAGWAALGLDTLFEGVGITLFTPDEDLGGGLKSVILSIIYSIIIAPVTEELLMRGFVQKNLSRVSQRFGIFMTAFLFGVWHENVAQFILAFLVGIFFGYIDAKHDSLVPSIICHMAVNTLAELGSIFDQYGWDMAYTVLEYAYAALIFFGLIVLIRMLIVERLPRTTPHQAERGLRQAIASPLLMIACGCHIALAVTWIITQSN